MIKVVGLIVALLLSAPVQRQHASDPGQLREQLETVQRQLQAVIDKMPAGVSVPQGGDLQAALDGGGTINLPKAGTFAGARFVISKSGTVVNCQGSIVTGATGPAFWIKPGVDDVTLTDCGGLSGWDGAAFQLGDNDATTQGTAALVPKRIRLVHPFVSTHRGKRGIEVNANATIVNPQILDVYSGEVNPQDSQAIAVLNTCGPVSVLGGTLVAGSENFLTGGDRLQVKDCPEGVVADVLLDDVTLTKPEIWREQQTRVAPKTVLELKACKRCTVRNSRINGSYRAVSTAIAGATQDGSCIVITPKNGQYIETVLFENNTIERCAQGLQLMGSDYNSVTPKPTSGVVFRGNRWTIDGATYNGRGISRSWSAECQRSSSRTRP